ncbi:conserved hypothetical protein [Nitrosopumilaceae archaeon]|nr:conserved hypothetical protein [Nitrosopumilaceae archaeon]
MAMEREFTADEEKSIKALMELCDYTREEAIYRMECRG